MGTSTPPAFKMPKTAGINSGRFFSHRPTRSPGFTPKSRASCAATPSDCARRVWYVNSVSPQNIATFSRSLLNGRGEGSG